MVGTPGAFEGGKGWENGFRYPEYVAISPNKPRIGQSGSSGKKWYKVGRAVTQGDDSGQDTRP